MAISAAQETVTTSPAKLCVIPPGPCTVLVSNTGTTITEVVYVGAGPGAVSAASGVPVPAGRSVPLTFPPGSPQAVLQAVGVVPVVVGVLISHAGFSLPPSAVTPGPPGPSGGTSAPGLAIPGEMVPGSPGR